MKAWTMIASCGIATTAILGIAMTTSNPEPLEYEEYAVEKLTTYLKTDFCQKTPDFLQNLVQFNCNQLVDSANPKIKDIISATTERQDYVVFSIYTTDLKFNNLIPGYTFKTVGAFDNFYTYKVNKQ